MTSHLNHVSALAAASLLTAVSAANAGVWIQTIYGPVYQPTCTYTIYGPLCG